MRDARNKDTANAFSIESVRVGLGCLALIFFFAHTIFHASEGHPEHMLWTCNLASILIGLGLIIRSPLLNAIGLLWLIPGIPIWLYGVATGSRLLFTSFLTHVGGLIISTVGIRSMGFPPGVWWRALLGVIAFQHLARLVTPSGSNVNIAFRPGPGFESLSYEVFVVLLGVAMGIVFWVLELSIRRLVNRSRTAKDRKVSRF